MVILQLKAAPKARNMKARGKREAQRNASPLVTRNSFEPSTESAKYQTSIIPLFQSFTVNCALLPGATRLTSFGACPWLSYSAPFGAGIRGLKRVAGLLEHSADDLQESKLV